MKRLFISLASLAVFMSFFFSCYYDNEEALYPNLNSSCDTTNVTYSATIEPILNNNCYSCHSDANAAFGGNVHLQRAADVISMSSRIAVAIKRTGAFPMPPSGKLNSCAISQFDLWVKKGTPDN
jgi:hypothetical protein